MTLIAERDLRFRSGGAVQVLISAPVAGSKSAKCRLQVLGLKAAVDLEAEQIDTLGALLYAIEMASVAVHASEEAAANILEWPLSPRDPDLGMPPDTRLFGVTL